MFDISRFLLLVLLVTTCGSDTSLVRAHRFPEFEKIASFLQPLVAQVDGDGCREQLEVYLKSLANSSLWAVQMFDASAKIPQGFLTSDAYDLGNYDGCVDVNLKREGNDNIFGRYCLAILNIVNKEDYRPGFGGDSADFFMEPEMSAWEELMAPVFRYGFANNVFRSAVCVPNKCTPRDVERIYRFLYNNASSIRGGHVVVSVPENACSARDSQTPATAALINQIIASIIFCVTTSTILDLLGWCDQKFVGSVSILKTLSAYRNFKSLTSSTHPQHNPVAHSLKVYALIFLVIIRRLSFLINGPIVNRKTADEVLGESFKENFFDFSNNIIGNTFTVVGGFLHFQKVYWYFRRDSKLALGRVYLAEFLKTTPLYLLVISFNGYVFETVGDGPMWKERTENSVENCKRNWMVNLAQLNNFARPDNACIFESWYFAVIAQCFVSVPIVVRLLVKSSTTGLTTLGLLTGAALLLPILVIYFDLFPLSNNNDSFRPRHPASSSLPFSVYIFKLRLRNLQCHQRINTGTADRALSYFLGVWSALIHAKIRDQKWSVSQTQFKLFSLLAAVCATITVSVPFVFHSPRPTILQSSIINALTQLLWGLTLSWVIVGVSVKKLRALVPVLRQRHLLPLSRLTHPYLLILGMVQMYTTGTMRTLDCFSFPRLVWMSTADLLATAVFAFIFYMAVQKPVGILVNATILRSKF